MGTLSARRVIGLMCMLVLYYQNLNNRDFDLMSSCGKSAIRALDVTDQGPSMIKIEAERLGGDRE